MEWKAGFLVMGGCLYGWAGVFAPALGGWMGRTILFEVRNDLVDCRGRGFLLRGMY